MSAFADAVVLMAASHNAVRSLARKENALHKSADKHLDAMTTAVMYGFILGKKALGKPPNAKRAAKAIREGVVHALPSVLLKVLVSGGDVGLSQLRSKGLIKRRAAVAASVGLVSLAGPLKMRFDAKDPAAIKWAQEHAGELADGLSETSHDRIKEAIASMLGADEDESEAYDRILSAVGDDVRAEMIARTEVMKASNEGLSQSWSQAVDIGLLNGDEKKEWIATAGCCDDCDELDGEQVPIDDDFSIGDDPPAHPNCRCTMGIAGGSE